MKLACIRESAADVKIRYYDAEEDQEVYDGQIYKKCEDITSDEIYVSRDSELLYVAYYGNEPVGCLWGKVTRSDDEDYEYVFSTDIVVAHQYRNLLIGPKLVKTAINEYESLRDQYDDSIFMGCEVVNHKLAEYLQRRHGFQHMDRHGNWGEGEWSINSPYLVYDGSPISSRSKK